MTKTRPHPSTPTADLHELMAQRFPLLPRTKPVCRALDVRVARVRDLADQGTGESLVRAGEACNLAALIMSDCGLPALARTMCWQQFDAFPTSRAYDAATAKLALQPLINLGRLLIRDGDGSSAYQLLSGLYEAVKGQTDSAIDGRTLSFSSFVRPGDDHTEIVRWLWSVLLADGTRALTRSGQWTLALQHAQQHKGIGQRLLDGRQVAILTHAATGDSDTASRLLSDTDAATPWEKDRRGLHDRHLSATRRPASRCQHHHHDDQIPQARTSPRARGLPHPLGLCILDLATDTVDTQRVADVVVHDALNSTDAYAAHDALSHPTCRANSDVTNSRRLIRIVKASGLRQGTISADTHNDLMESVNLSTASITDALAQTH